MEFKSNFTSELLNRAPISPIYSLKSFEIRSDVTKYDVLKASFDEIVKDFGSIHGL